MPQTDETTARLTAAGLSLIQQALSIFDGDLRLAVCNRRYQDMFSLPDALVTPGAHFEDTIRFLVTRGEYGPVDDLEDAVRVRVDTARAFEPHYMERRRANGRWISVEGAPLAQGGWVTVYTDITEIKHQEALLRARSAELSDQVLAHTERLGQANRKLAATNAALEAAKAELTAMEARTRLTTEMMPAHIARVDRSLSYTFSNRRLTAILPGRPTEILGLHGREALGAETFARIEPNLLRALDGVASVMEFTDPDTGRRIRAAFNPDRPAEGPVAGVYILSMDVTEESQARAALAQTRKRELAAQLTSGLAHDFANLLTIILGLQSRLAALPGLPDAGAELVAATTAAARRGGRLLDRIGAISGPRTLHPAPVTAAALLEELRVLAGPTLPDAVMLSTADETDGGAVLLDAGAIQDALLNLLLNARDAIGTAGTITVTARMLRDTWLEFAVADSGPGFTPLALQRGLDPFFTTKGGEGSGLGLAMVYDHAKLAGGSVRLANRPAGGAEVTLRLPLRRAATDAPDAATIVLLVEDSPELRATTREMLRGLGHQVIEAATGDEALALADLPGIGIVLSDISLPGTLSGVDLVELLRQRAHPAQRRLITALPEGDALRARGAALCPVLAKPFDRAALAACLAGEGPP